jgi:soluble lytic murein transglycosylase-like protein
VRSKERAIAARSEDHVTARPVARSAPIAGGNQTFGAQQPAAAAPPPAAESQRRSSFAAAGDVSADPQRWAEWIAILRSQGQHDLADAQLKLLRERYPDFTVPASALRAP